MYFYFLSIFICYYICYYISNYISTHNCHYSCYYIYYYVCYSVWYAETASSESTTTIKGMGRLTKKYGRWLEWMVTEIKCWFTQRISVASFTIVFCPGTSVYSTSTRFVSCCLRFMLAWVIRTISRQLGKFLLFYSIL